MRKTFLAALAIVAAGSVSTSAFAGRDRGCDDDRGYRDSYRYSHKQSYHYDDCRVQPRVNHCAPRRPAIRFHVDVNVRSHGHHRSYDRRHHGHGGYRRGC